jgi:hypothetical protein
MAPDSARKLGDTAWIAAEPGAYELHAEVAGVSENIFEFEVKP